jgi:hypothetical protein
VVPGVDDLISNLGKGERDGGISVELLLTTGGGDFEVSSGREDDGKEISAALAVVVPGDGAKDHLESGIDLRGRLALRDCVGTRWGSRCRRRDKRNGSRGASGGAGGVAGGAVVTGRGIVVATGWALTATGEGPGGGGVYRKVVGKATVCGISGRGRVLRAASSTSPSQVRLADGAGAMAARVRVSTMG